MLENFVKPENVLVLSEIEHVPHFPRGVPPLAEVAEELRRDGRDAHVSLELHGKVNRALTGGRKEVAQDRSA